MLEIKNLTKYYGKKLGIENLSLKLEKGEILGLIGPNGAGKSTTIRSIMNLISKTSGEVYIQDELFDKNNIKLKEIIGYLPSEINLYDDLTVKEMIHYHESFYTQDLSQRRKQLIHLLQIDEHKKIEDLSLGNKKKIGILLALLHRPQILILDEPTSGLDPIMQQTFYQLLLEEKNKGTSIIYSTHILSEVSKICDRVAVIKDGHLLKVESIQDLLEKNFTYVLIESKDIDFIEKDLQLEVIDKKENMIKLKNTLDYNVLISKLSQYSIDRLLIEESTLEDMFLHFYE